MNTALPALVTRGVAGDVVPLDGEMMAVSELPGPLTANTDDPRWRPLRVTARMAESIMYSGHRIDLHLDGIIAAGAFRFYRRPVPHIHSPWVQDFDLPLARWAILSELTRDTDPRLTLDGQITEVNGKPHGWIWGWAASNATARWLRSGRREVRKRPETGRMVQWTDERSFNLALGPQKAYNLDYPTVFAHEVSWYVLGEAQRIMACLSGITHIGKKHNQGNGRVLEWQIEDLSAEGADPRQWWYWKDDRIMRRLPIAFAPDRHACWASIRPPYHHPSRRVLSVECELPTGPEMEDAGDLDAMWDAYEALLEEGRRDDDAG